MILKLIDLPDPVASNIAPFPSATGVTQKKKNTTTTDLSLHPQ
jgi:hypothetical protein